MSAMSLYRLLVSASEQARVCLRVCVICVHCRPAAHRLIRSSCLLFFFGLFFIVVLRSIHNIRVHIEHIEAKHKERELHANEEEEEKKAPHHIRAFCKFKRVPDTSMRLLGNFSLFSLFTSNECVFLFICCFFFSFFRLFFHLKKNCAISRRS